MWQSCKFAKLQHGYVRTYGRTGGLLQLKIHILNCGLFDCLSSPQRPRQPTDKQNNQDNPNNQFNNPSNNQDDLDNQDNIDNIDNQDIDNNQGS